MGNHPKTTYADEDGLIEARREQLSVNRQSDFGLIATLVTSGYDIQRTEQEGRRVFFVFDESPGLEKTVNDYWSGGLLVSARQFFDNTKMLKSRIYGR